MKSWKFTRTLAVCGAAGMLGACAQPPKHMYNWEAYQPAVYAYLTNEDAVAQIEGLERNIEVARAKNEALPPGFHAHLGMLYLHVGQADKAAEQIQAEKLAFPEATVFMNFLLRNAKPSELDKASSASLNSTEQD